MKKILIILALIAGLHQTTKASHFLGGEITWECFTSGTNAGKIAFEMKLYCACYLGAASCPTGAQSLVNPLYSTYGGTSTISMAWVNSPGLDLSPSCYDPTKQLQCGITIAAGGGNAMKEYVYRSSPLQINGPPAAGGTVFGWYSCCRPSLVNMPSSSSGYYLRAVMYPYTDPSTSSVLSMGTTTGGPSCYDSSPKFVERPATTICTGYPFTYNHNATDKELDSLDYEWGQPMVSATNGATWNAGYSTTNQLPSTYQNTSNVPATVNRKTGEISFTTYSPQGGYHATCIKVTAYKCRQKVAEIFRDIPVVLLACPPTPTFPPIANTPPDVTFKWFAGSTTSLSLPAADTVLAGDSVVFYIISTDVEFLPGFVGQTNYLRPSGSQFGTTYSSTTSGCLYPPCATMDHNSYYNSTANEWRGQYGIATYFRWKTDCNHLAQVNACFTKSNTYSFVFKVLDNWCPAPGLNFQTFAVTVEAPPGLDPPELKCAQVQNNGNVLLKWTQPITLAEDSFQSFRKYVVYRSDSGIAGPYDTVHVDTVISSTQWMDLTASAHISGKYYVIQGVSSCNDQYTPIWSDTIAAMHLTAAVYNAGNSVALDWNDFNPNNKWGSTTTGEYYVWQILGTDTTIIDTVTESWDTLQINLCYPANVQYFVTVEDTTLNWGCTSRSSIDGGTVGDNLPPPPIQLDSVSYNSGGSIDLGWTATSPDIGMYYIYKGGVLIDSVPPAVRTFQYSPVASDPCQVGFAIAARDTCGNVNSANLTQYASCTRLNDVVKCKYGKKIQISWDQYNPSWPGSSSSHEIYRSINGGPYVLIGTTPSVDTTYKDTALSGITLPADFCYMVQLSEQGSPRGALTKKICYTLDRLIDETVIDAPDLRCISWQKDSTIRLEWNKPLNPKLNFDAYFVFHSTTNPSNNDPYNTQWTVKDSIKGVLSSDNLAWDSIGATITNIDPNVSNYFMVTTRSGCYADTFASVGTKKMQPINLAVTSLGDADNQLDWNAPVGTQQTPNYLIFRDNNNIGNAAFGNETYTDNWAVCDKDVKYQIYYPDVVFVGGCASKSLPIDGKFLDNTPPAKQFVDSVSMKKDTTFNAIVGWSPNLSDDVVKYYVINCTQGAYKILDTVASTSPLFYDDFANAPLNKVTNYTIVAEDSCGNNTLSSQDFNCHATIFEKPVLDFCDQSITISWNAYSTFISGNGVYYKVYMAVNGGTFNQIGELYETKFKYSELINGNDYCFYVQAWDNDGFGPFSSSSAVSCIKAEFIRPPEFAYMRYVTVADSNLNRLAVRVDLDSDIGEYWVKRSNEKDKGYRTIATVALAQPPSPSDSNFYFEDSDVKSDRYSYFYKVDVIDPCGQVGITSNIGRSIRLAVTADNETNHNVLTWNRYEEWEGKVKEYVIYRGLDLASMKPVHYLPVAQFGNIAELSTNGDYLVYSDDISIEATSGNGEFCYQVYALEGTGTFQGIEAEHSRSNIACAIQYPLFYIPTAFTPNGDGVNDSFKPKGSFHDLQSYRLEIYNRWGERIFSSENYDEGWDGTVGGKDVPQGSYVYIVNYTAADGKGYEERGSMSLTR